MKDAKNEILGYLDGALNLAEKVICKRDMSFNYPKVNFDYTGDIGGGQMCVRDNNLEIQIKEGLSYENQKGLAVRLLAHEVVHCLRPTTFDKINRLEEGIATWFGEYFLEKNFPGSDVNDVDDFNYKSALDDFKMLGRKELLSAYMNSKPELKFSDITPTSLCEIYGTKNNNIIRNLLLRFSY